MAGCFSCHPTNSAKALKVTRNGIQPCQSLAPIAPQYGDGVEERLLPNPNDPNMLVAVNESMPAVKLCCKRILPQVGMLTNADCVLLVKNTG